MAPASPLGDLTESTLAELNELLWALPSALDPYAIVSVLLERGARLFDSPLAGVWFRQGQAYDLAGSYGLTDKKADQLWERLHLANRPAEPWCIEGTELHALSAFGKRRLGALLAVPLPGPSGLVGWAVLARLEPRPYSDLETQFITMLLARAAHSIENARRFQETEARQRELSLLYEITQLLVSTLRLDELLTRLAQRMTETFDLTGCGIRLHDPEQDRLLMRALYHRDPASQAELARLFAQSQPRPTEGRTGQILQRNEAYVARNVADDNLMEPEVRALLSPGSLVAAPLCVRSRPIGVLYWFRQGRSRPLNEAMLPLLSHLASQVALAIEHAQLYSELERKVAERTADLAHANQALTRRIAEGEATITAAGEALRSQLHNVLGYAGLLQHSLTTPSPDPTKQHDYLEKLMTSAETVHERIEALMDWIRAEGLSAPAEGGLSVRTEAKAQDA